MRIFITVTCVFIYSSLSAQNFKHADKYFGVIQRQHKNVVKEFLQFNKVLSYVDKNNSSKKVEKVYVKLIAEISEAKKNIDSLPAFKKDSSYRDSASSYFKQYAVLINGDYNKVTLIKKESGQSYDNMQAFLHAKETADQKMKKLDESFFEITGKFATTYKIKLDDKKYSTNKKMDEIIKTTDYFNPIYLLFFKNYKLEDDVQNAIERKDANDLKKISRDLLKSSEDGQSSLDTTVAFNNDKSLVAGCKPILVFYEKEADVKLDPIADYFSEAKEFETIRAAFEKKPGHSGEDIKAYRKPVKEFNIALKKYNDSMSNIYKKKKSLIKKWDHITHKFINKHMPKL